MDASIGIKNRELVSATHHCLDIYSVQCAYQWLAAFTSSRKWAPGSESRTEIVALGAYFNTFTPCSSQDYNAIRCSISLLIIII